MRLVGELVVNVLKAPESETVRAEVRQEVARLTAAHPIYQDLA